MNMYMNDLKTQMKEQNIYAYLVPHDDSFFNEMPTDYESRMKFLTGFTGSSGFSVITLDQCAFFVDGRYTLQVQMETKDYPWKYKDFTKESIINFIKDSVPLGSGIGYNPYLFSYSNIEFYTKQLKDFILEPQSPDLIDTIWNKTNLRPNAPYQQPFFYPNQYAGESSQEKIQRITSILKQKDAYATFIYQPDTICWILNIRGNDIQYVPTFLSTLYIDIDGRTKLYTYKNRVLSTQRLLHDHRIFAFEDNFYENGVDFLNSLKDRKILVDPNFTSFGTGQNLKQYGIRLEFHHELGYYEKSIKNQTEISGAFEAHILDGLSWIQLLYEITKTNIFKGKREGDIAKRLQYLRYIYSPYYVEDSFEPIVASGSNGTIAHYHTSETTSKIIEEDTLLLMDMGAQYWYGTTDCTRTIAIGNCTEEMKKNYTYVLKAHLSMTSNTYPLNVVGKDVDKSIRQTLLNNTDLNYNHGTGHGVGTFLSVHEGPYSISPLNTLPIKPNILFSNEPGCYLDHQYGIRIENMVLSIETDNHLNFITLTVVPYDRTLIQKDLLTKDEIHQINSYNNRVYTVLKDKLHPHLQVFLKELTQPL